MQRSMQPVNGQAFHTCAQSVMSDQSRLAAAGFLSHLHRNCLPRLRAYRTYGRCCAPCRFVVEALSTRTNAASPHALHMPR